MVQTIGCRLNEAESQVLRDRLVEAGYELVGPGEAAEVGILNSCTVTAEADVKCRKALRQFIKRNPEAVTAVIGCYGQTGAERLAAIRGVDFVLGNHDKFAVLDLLEGGKREEPLILRERIRRAPFRQPFVESLPYDKRGNLKVQDGCDFYCSFCIIPVARGPARPRERADLLAEARASVKRGIRELVLTGVNIGTWGESGGNLEDLVDDLAAVDGLWRIRISSIEPTTVGMGLVERMGDDRHPLMPLLHLPLQSGSDRVLEAMRRKYSVSEYKSFVEEAVEAVPDLCVGTDLLSGFPGETEAEFEASAQLLRELPFGYAHVFPYSAREGSLVERRGTPPVPAGERKRRAAVLRGLSERRQGEFRERFRGTVRPVLLEDPDADGFPGYTDNYLRVRVAHPGKDVRNQLALVRIGVGGADEMVEMIGDEAAQGESQREVE